MTSYETVTEALTDLKLRGYTVDFNISFDKIICSKNEICLNPAEFRIVAIYRFEGETNPSDEDVVYEIESKDGLIKGSMTSAYGIYADSISNEMIQKLSINK